MSDFTSPADSNFSADCYIESSRKNSCSVVIALFLFYANSSSRQKYHHGSFLAVRVIQYILIYIQDLAQSLQMILVQAVRQLIPKFHSQPIQLVPYRFV